MLEQIRTQIDKHLAAFIDKVRDEYRLQETSPVLYQSIREFCLRPGKRIRPLLIILSYKGYTPKNKRMSSSIYNAAACIELLHNFMLIHDDIIDRSNLRRGKPTMHRMLRNTVKTPDPDKLGQDLAIIAGDIVYALAIDAFLSIKEQPDRKERGLKYFIQTAAFTAMGEFIDTVHGVDSLKRVKEKDVFLNYTLKTARYTFDCPLVTGAILAGADNRDIKKLSRLGILIGQAFQIQDDIIGIFGSQKNIGKSILSDLAESKKTLLVCHTYENLKQKERKAFLDIFNKPTKTYADLVAIRKIFINAGSLDYSMKAINDRLKQTFKISQTLKMHDKQRHLIENAFTALFKQTRNIARSYQ